jgi:Ser/Thr protein kinase RdoA (MazF antagonist)
MDVHAIKLVGLFTNAIFRLYTAQGSYVMRVCEPGWRTPTDLHSEIMWLQYLNRSAEIHAPEPQLARNGDPYIVSGATGVPELRRCVVMSWVPGALLSASISEEHLFKLGQLFAALHEFSAGFSPGEGFTQLRMDAYLARGEEDTLFSASCENAFGPSSRTVIERTRALVEEAFEQLYAEPAGLRVIHNDLWHGNVKVYHGRLHPLDFEDTIWGFPVQDIAMSLQDLMVDVERDAYEPLQVAFRCGYETRATWPEQFEGQIDAFRAGRMLWVANYVARFQREYLPEHIEGLSGYFARFLDTGRIRKP